MDSFWKEIDKRRTLPLKEDEGSFLLEQSPALCVCVCVCQRDRLRRGGRCMAGGGGVAFSSSFPGGT